MIAPSTRQDARDRVLALTLVLGLATLWHPIEPVAPAAPARAAAQETAPLVEGHLLKRRWVLLQNNFQAQGNVAKVNAILDRAAAAGFNGAIFADTKFGRLDDGSLIDAYFTNLRAVLEHGRGLGLTMLPATADFGYSESILWHDPNLAEGMPAVDAPYVARGGLLVPDASAYPRLQNGDFEQLPASGHAFPGWAYQDNPGVATFVDRSVRHGGQASLRMEDLGRTNAPHGNGRVYQRLTVKPFQHYHLRVWVRTEGFQGGDVRALVLAQNPARTLQWNSIPVESTRDWTAFDVTFNTLTHTEVAVYFGVWGGERGTIWWDDGLLEPAGPVNLLRRDGAPLDLRSADGRTAFAVGQDVEAIVDPTSGRNPWPGSFDLWHAPPTIRLAAGSRIREGDTVLLSYHHATVVYGFQVAASLLEPKVLDIVAGQMAALRREFAAAGAFRGFMLSHDEIRVHGWDQAPMAGGGSPGEDLAENLRQVRARALAVDPAAELFVWSDMVDPFHNAADTDEPFYLVNGDWAGGWEGLDPSMGIVNWNSQPAKRRDSAAFFAGRGHKQLLAGYYDQDPSRFGDRAWLKDLTGVPGIEGVVYAQWGSGYGNLEAWATHVWGGASWVDVGSATSTPMPTTAPTTPPAPQGPVKLALPRVGVGR